MSDIANASASLQHFPAGAVIIPEGGRLGTLFVLRAGTVEIVREGTMVAEIDQPGAIFGELSVLLDMPHSATVRAASAVEVFAIGNALAVLDARPAWALQIARLLARRLLVTTEALVASRQVAPMIENMVLPAPLLAQIEDGRGWGDPTI